ncbi:hypothetical protein MANAM107_13250 [Actinomyces capricornis]|uniref:RelB antitoxin n=2 Tax=Actinomyces capricornis TaxID=2755559 RepID=A0ABN6K6D4_9ACTO|nr:hypothetical protein MANAM107_13250 [Actinomyces capricornis]
MVISAPAWHTAAMPSMTTIKVQASTRDGVRALAERQGMDMDAAIRWMTALAERELHFAELEAAMAANPPDESYLAELADWESEAWSGVELSALAALPREGASAARGE